jgi:hypothetical protein
VFVVRSNSPAFRASGMTEGSSFTLPSAYTTVTGWVADTSHYPGSTVSSNGLVVQNTKTGAVITCNVGYTSSFAMTVTLRLFQNGTQIAQGSATASATSGTATVSATVNVTVGDVITVQASASQNNFGSTTTGAATFMTIV